MNGVYVGDFHDRASVDLLGQWKPEPVMPDETCLAKIQDQTWQYWIDDADIERGVEALAQWVREKNRLPSA